MNVLPVRDLFGSGLPQALGSLQWQVSQDFLYIFAQTFHIEGVRLFGPKPYDLICSILS